jgi:SpoVK/Ycf46/Vps4 family AAA+-type ATPase
MKTKFYPSGNVVMVSTFNEAEGSEKLAPNVYGIAKSLSGFYLTIKSERLEVPPKIYGKTLKRADKIINTYQDRTTSTGVLLTGDKGSGKTMLSSLVANNLIDVGLPIISINEPWQGEEFMDFLNKLGECVVLFDEFAKTYARADENAQTSLLTLMDGVGSTKRLIILTENDEKDINSFMINRPGRIYYHFRYTKLDEDSIKGYAQDKGVTESVLTSIVDMSRTMHVFTFDILKAIVEEHLRNVDEDITELVTDMNVSYDKNVKIRLRITKVVLSSDNTEYKVPMIHSFINKPMQGGGGEYIHYIDPTVDKKAEEYYDGEEIVSTHIYNGNIKFESEGKYVYDNGSFIITAVEVESAGINYGSYLG